MTALAGIWRFGHSTDGVECAAMLAAQRRFGPHAESVECHGEVALGRSLFRLLPEDSFDRQPSRAGDGRYLVVADLRIDNRGELLSALGETETAELADSHLLGRAWDRWGPQLLDWLLGDFAFAIWDRQERTFFLARDPVGERPLFYHLSPGLFAFTSMPAGLHAIADVPEEIDQDQLAAFVADIPRSGEGTYFRGVSRVEPGHYVRVTPAGARSFDYWRRPDQELRLPRAEDYVEAFREQLDRATGARLRRATGAIAAHLSAGLDSNAVAATAARLLAPQGERLLAFTSAPDRDFQGPVPRGRIADESGYAAATAAFHPNIDHRILRPGDVSPLDAILRDGRTFPEPIGHPCNHVWWSAINERARAEGASVILTGEAGNLTISAGSLAMLADLIRTGHLRQWLRQAKASLRSGGPSWRGVLASSFGPFIPRFLWTYLARSTDRHSTSDRGLALLAPEWRARLSARANEAGRGSQPISDNRALRWQALRSLDSGAFRKETLGRWWLDERDPTADRRLAEFCLSLPPEIFYSEGMSRRLARVAMRDRLPPQVLEAPRGYQFADWYRRIDQAGLEGAADRLAQAGPAGLFDLDRVRRLASDWPPEDLAGEEAIGTYRLAMLRSLSAGHFAGQAG